jgi:hypothetical protein
MNTDHPKHSRNACFSWFVNKIDYARDLLPCILPPKLLEQLDLSTLRVVSPDQTDSRLRNHRADVLFSGAALHRASGQGLAATKAALSLYSAGGYLQQTSTVGQSAVAASDVPGSERRQRDVPAVSGLCTGPAADGK